MKLNLIYSKLYNKYIPENKLVFSSLVEDYLYLDQSVLVYNYETKGLEYAPKHMTVFSNVYNKHILKSQSIYSDLYRTFIPKKEASFCLEHNVWSNVSDFDPRFFTYEDPNGNCYAKSWYKFGTFSTDTLSNNLINTITIVNREDVIKAIVKFVNEEKLDEFKQCEDKVEFLRTHTTMRYRYLENTKIDIDNSHINRLIQLYNSGEDRQRILRELENIDFFIVI